MNPSYLSTLFHKHMGMTLSRFITVKRLHYAKKLLRESSLSVTDIAYLSGFNHHTYFNRMFKKQEQISPLAYRKNHLRHPDKSR
ncbi:HTH-type transcriptional activator Btr [compost metagenome]